jgi:hypothetical protein
LRLRDPKTLVRVIACKTAKLKISGLSAGRKKKESNPWYKKGFNPSPERPELYLIRDQTTFCLNTFGTNKKSCELFFLKGLYII